MKAVKRKKYTKKIPRLENGLIKYSQKRQPNWVLKQKKRQSSLEI